MLGEKLQPNMGIESGIFPKNEIEKIYSENHGSAGHGTSIETAIEILNSGIRVNEGYGHQEILLPLSGIPNNQLETLLSAWPHKNAKAIVVVCIPDKDGFNRSADIIGEVFDEKLRRTRSYIPPNLIKGYFDVDQKKFIDNPVWESDPAPLEKPGRAKLRTPRSTGVSIPIITNIPEHVDEGKDVW